MTSSRTREYAVVLILSPEAAESETQDTIKRILRLLSELGGNISWCVNLGIQPLNYPVHHFSRARCFVIGFTLDTQMLVELNGAFNSDQAILRHQIRNLTKSTTTSPESKVVNQPYPESIIEFMESEDTAITAPVYDEDEYSVEQGDAETTDTDDDSEIQETGTSEDAEEDSGRSVSNEDDIRKHQVTESNDLEQELVVVEDRITEESPTETVVADNEGEIKETDSDKGGGPGFAEPIVARDEVEEYEILGAESESEDQKDIAVDNEGVEQESIDSAAAGDENEGQDTIVSDQEDQEPVEPIVAQNEVEGQDSYESEDGEPELVAARDGIRETYPTEPVLAGDETGTPETVVDENRERAPAGSDVTSGQHKERGGVESNVVPFARKLFEDQSLTPLAASESDVYLPQGGPRTSKSAREDTRQSGRYGRSGSRVSRIVTQWEPTKLSRELENRFKDMVLSDYSGRCQICGNTFMKPDRELQVFVVHLLPPSADHRTNHFGNLLGLCGWHYALVRYGQWILLDPATNMPFENWEDMRGYISSASEEADDQNTYFALPIRIYGVYQDWSSTPKTPDQKIIYSVIHWKYLNELLST